MKTLGLVICIFVVLRGTTAAVGTACEHSTLNINCGSDKIIQITSASYGRSDRTTCRHSAIHTTSCRALSSETVVRGACHGKHSCSVRASNNVFGDPCHGTYKYLRVVYYCKSTSMPSVTICEHQKRTISCPSGKVLDIISAVYGRSDRTTCPHSSIRTTSCAASASAIVVKANCNGKSSCTLHASNSVFGDPCHGTFKYLAVKYQCVLSNVIMNTICENKMGVIGCPLGKQIRIVEAIYGRTNKNTCPHKQTSNTSCIQNVKSKVKNSCEGKPYCVLTPSNSDYGDPCRGTYKYLSIKHVCVV